MTHSKYLIIWLLASCLFIFFFSCLENADSSLSGEDTTDFSEEELYLMDYESPSEKWGYLDTSGSMIIEARFDQAREFSESLAAVNKNGKWGYIDPNGKWLIQAKFRSAHRFKNGIARVQTLDKKYGFIDTSGEYILTPSYDEIYDFNSGLARLKTGLFYQYIQLNGDSLENARYQQADDFNDGWARVKDVKYGLIDSTGDIRIPLKYDRIYYPSDGMIRFKEGDKYGYLSLSGKVLIRAKYDRATDFQQGTAMVTLDEVVYFLQKDGQIVEIPERKFIGYAGEGIWKVKDLSGSWCLINAQNQSVTPCRYSVINNFQDGLAVYQRAGYYGYLNPQGKEITPPLFPLCWDFQEGLARVIAENGVGYIDRKGELAIPAYYFENRDFSEGLARVQVY